MAEIIKSSPGSHIPDAVFKFLALASAVTVILLMGGFFVQLLYSAQPAMAKFGIGFLFSSEWDPVRKEFGGAAAIWGTLVTTFIAMVIAVPASFLIAMFLVELAPPFISKTVGHAIDLLAAVPSIIFGMWGLFVLVPHIQSIQMGMQVFLIENEEPMLNSLSSVPWLRSSFEWILRTFFDGAPIGMGLVTAGVVLAVMILPFITAVMRDVFRMVPPVVKESAYGTGATTWEVTKDVTMRYGMQGLLGAVFLGLGRAIGETMAVLFIIGNTMNISFSIFGSGSTISSVLANNFAEADGIYKSTLFELGLILFAITFLIQVAAQYWLNKVRKSAGGGL